MEINMKNTAMDLDFHPSNQLVAAGLITGNLLIYRYAEHSNPQRQLRVRAHRESCTSVRFINEGRVILTASSDCSILATDTETGSQIARLKNSHDKAVTRLVNLTETTIASGGDEGCIKVWDTRQQSCCNSFQVHQDYITDITFDPNNSMTLLGASGDGTISVCNLRTNKVETQSEFSEDEPLSIVVMKNGRKVICGTESGTMLLYSWGFFKDCSDRFTGFCSNPVNALLKVDEERVIAGTENGLISLVGVLPNRIIQPIAQHSEYYPVERLAVSNDRKFLGSISHDFVLKLWDVDSLLQENGKKVDEGDQMDLDKDDIVPKSSKGTKRRSNGGAQGLDTTSDFFADL